MSRKRRGIPWLDQRDGIYYAYWYDAEAQTTKRLSLRTGNSDEAQSRFAAFLVAGKIIREPERLDGLTVSQVLDDYEDEHVAVNVIDHGRQGIAIEHLKTWFKDTPVKDVDIPACREYAKARRDGRVNGRKVGDATIRRELQIIGAAANHALRWKRIKRDDLPIVELPSEKAQEPISDGEWLTKAEYKRALDGADGILRQLIVLTYGAASRKTAIESLSRFQVDLKRGLLTLRHPSETELQRRSKKRRPIVPITGEMRPVLEELLLEPPKDDGRLFPPDTDFYHRFKFHMEKLGLGHKGYPHILRHSRATHLLMDGVSIWDVAKLLGDTVATVERVYGHASPEHLGRTIEGRSMIGYLQAWWERRRRWRQWKREQEMRRYLPAGLTPDEWMRFTTGHATPPRSALSEILERLEK
jgi:integrase